MWGWGKTKFMYTFSSEKKKTLEGVKCQLKELAHKAFFLTPNC